MDLLLRDPRCSRPRFLAAIALTAFLLPAAAWATPCFEPDASGTVYLPPAGCPYVSPTDFHIIVNGLPAGTTIQVGVEHSRFINIVHSPGGTLGGEIEHFQSTLTLTMQGTGSLSGFSRTVPMQANCETHTAPHTPYDPVQSFDTEMFGIQGQLPPGDPDFDLLRITAGSGFGMPSPGHTTLTRQPGGNWAVDSFFDITYRIDFIGHPGGPLGGMSGSTTGTIRMGAGEASSPPTPTCVAADNGSGTVNLPPVGCGYVSPEDLHMIINGLPPNTTIQVGLEHQEFFNSSSHPGGTLGGEVENFQSFAMLTMNGTGDLAGYSRVINLGPVTCETHIGPRTPGDPVQSFDTEMFMLQGQLPPGDPDFDLLRITAGSGFGLPSPGHTTLTQLSGGNWNVDSFFDITYRIDFVGHPGGPLGGMSGSTTGTIRMTNGHAVPPPNQCLVADDGTGTVQLPPVGCGYLSPDDVHKIIDGLPPGTTIELGAQHAQFFNIVNTPDPTGGENEQFQSALTLTLNGTGDLAGFHRDITMQTACEATSGPRTPGTPRQDFDTDMKKIQGQLPPGDPDFDLLRVTAGTDFGMPSPGHTTLTRIPGTGPQVLAPMWNVHSFFDITYRIDFVGSPGGALAGRSGSTTATIRMQTGQPSLLGVPAPPITTIKIQNSPNPFGAGTTIQYRLPTLAHVRLVVYDAAGHQVRRLTDERMPAGPHAMMWDGLSDKGHRLGSGMYFIKLVVNGKTVGSTKATLVR